VRKSPGFSLHEVLVTLVIASVAVSMAVPRLEGVIRRERVRAALNRLAGDLEFTRITAVRTGRPTVLRFVRHPLCAGKGGREWIVARRGSADPLRRGGMPDDYPACYTSTNSDSVTYGSRGLLAPYNNRTIRAVDGTVRDSLTISAVGRIYRRF
jgi:prepilin-type N-terminal cleavage/methylation domain-containing protein